jgi:multisubunit Na+/H+ antiporter MnhB subunit
MEALIPLLGIIVPFATVFGIVYIVFSTRHRERMNMIDKGMDPQIAKPAPDGRRAMRNGLLMVGIGLGLLTGWIIQHTLLGPESENPLPFLIGVAILGGMSLVAYYQFYGRKQEG